MEYKLAKESWDIKEYESLKRVIDSNMFTMGSEVSSCEKKFAAWNGSKYSIMVNSGSSANLLMVAALMYHSDESLRLKSGDEVIVPAVSWSTTYYPLYQYGLKLKFVDIDIDTLNYSLKDLESAISTKTACIMCVNLLGNPNDFDAINRIIKDSDIFIIEDNCESLGASIDDRKSGTFGVMGTYSSYFSHHISSIEGGFVVTNDEELYHIMLSLRSHGWTRSLPLENKVTGVKSKNDFEESFKFVLPGYNLRPIEFMGALASDQLDKLDNFVQVRQENAKLFLEICKSYEFIKVQKTLGESSWFGFSIICINKAHEKRHQVIDIFKDHGIETRPIVSGNFTKNEVIKYFDYEIHGTLDNAKMLDKSGFFIGNHHLNMSEEFEVLTLALDSVEKSLNRHINKDGASHE